MTAMSSARPATTPRSWVTRIIAMWRSVCWAWSRSRIWAWTVTSSAVVGSSAKSRRGPQARAMAMVTRWRMPPESWWGYSFTRWAGSGMPTERSRAIAVSLASPLSMSRWWRSDSVIWLPTFITGLSEVIGSWKTMAISVPQSLASPSARSRRRRCPRRVALPVRTTLRVGSRPDDRAGEDRLARSGLAHHTERLAPAEVEAHAVDGADRAPLGEEVGPEVDDLEQRGRASTSVRARMIAGGPSER